MTKFDPNKHHRRSIRLRDWDYRATGAYFVTLVAHKRECLFGDVVEGVVELSEYGEIARSEWMASDAIRSEIKLDEFVIMPNHLHGIVWIIVGAQGLVGAHGCAPQLTSRTRADGHPRRLPKSLGSFIAGYKSAVTKRVNSKRGTPGIPVWQRNYYERIIRNEQELDAIRRYILANPIYWTEDMENPVRMTVE